MTDRLLFFLLVAYWLGVLTGDTKMSARVPRHVVATCSATLALVGSLYLATGILVDGLRALWGRG